MDPIKLEKLQAMKRYRMKRFLPAISRYVLSVIMLGLFLSSPLWLPTVCSCLKLLFVTLPKMAAAIFGPKCLFLLVCNVIIVFLVGESKRSPRPSQRPDIYEEYVKRNESLHRKASSGEGQGEGKGTMRKDSVVEEEEEEEEEEEGLPAEELNKRAEDFIARFIMQRKIEARGLVCHE